MTVSIWREEKVKWCRGMVRGKLAYRQEVGLVSDDAPGLYVKPGQWAYLDDAHRDVPMFYGGKVHILSTGASIGSASAGIEPACELATALAKLHDWTTCAPGAQTRLSHESFEAVRALLDAAEEADAPRIAALIAAQPTQEEEDRAFGERIEEMQRKLAKAGAS